LQVYLWFYDNLIWQNSTLCTWSSDFSAKKKDTNTDKKFLRHWRSTLFEFSSSLLLKYDRYNRTRVSLYNGKHYIIISLVNWLLNNYRIQLYLFKELTTVPSSDQLKWRGTITKRQ